MIRLLFITVMLVSCQGADQYFMQGDNEGETVDPSVLEYYERFEDIYATEVQHIPATLDDLDRKSAGRCIIYNTGEKEIVLDKAWWEVLDDSSKEMLVFHELAHCHFNRGHNDGTVIMDGIEIPESIMSTKKFDTNIYTTNRDYYLEELAPSWGYDELKFYEE